MSPTAPELGSGAEGRQIAVVASLLGLPVPTIRSWERRYGFPVPPRTGGRHRRYTDLEIEQLRGVRDLITKGHSTKEAVEKVRTGLSAGGAMQDALGEFAAAALTHDPDALRAVLERSADQVGVEAAIRDVLLPGMNRIGSAWKAGSCDVATEHLATGAVRSWLARQAAMAPPPFRPHPVVLSCGPKDLHTIGLEAFAVLLARRGWPCRVLGAMTPAEAVVTATASSGAAAVVVVSQRAVTRRAAIESLHATARLGGVKIFYAGDAFATPAARQTAPGTYLGSDILVAVDVLEAEVGSDSSGRRRVRAGSAPV